MNLAPFIDHSVLKPNATREEIMMGAQHCIEHHFVAYCVNSIHVELAVNELSGSDVRVAATIAFPFGTVPSFLKAEEAVHAVRMGAKEIDIDAGQMTRWQPLSGRGGSSRG